MFNPNASLPGRVLFIPIAGIQAVHSNPFQAPADDFID
jgi:hypothetical protein